MFAHNPHLDVVEPFSAAAAATAIYLHYDGALPPPRPLATMMAECVGLALSVDRLEPDPAGGGRLPSCARGSLESASRAS